MTIYYLNYRPLTTQYSIFLNMITRKFAYFSKWKSPCIQTSHKAHTLVFKRVHEDLIPKDRELPIQPECRIFEPKHEIYKVNRVISGPQTLQVILSEDSLEYGVKGELVTIRKYIARKLLHKGQAVYASPENLQKYKEAWQSSEQSIYGRRMLLFLRKCGLLICPISDSMEWELNNHLVARLLEKYHGIVCDLSTITMPNYAIKSTDPDVWEKIHSIKITVNKIDSEHIKIQLSPQQPMQL